MRSLLQRLGCLFVYDIGELVVELFQLLDQLFVLAGQSSDEIRSELRGYYFYFYCLGLRGGVVG